jgi:hypothetical protein
VKKFQTKVVEKNQIFKPWALSATVTIFFDISTKQNCYAVPTFSNTTTLPMESVCHPHIRHGHNTFPLT